MSSQSEDENEEIYVSAEADDSTPITSATQTLDLLALHLPPEKLIPYLVSNNISYYLNRICNIYYLEFIIIKLLKSK